MRTKNKTVAGLTAAMAVCGALAIVPTSAGAAAVAKSRPAPAGGVAFVAETAAGGLNIVLSADRRRVRTALFSYEQTCSDGDTTYDYDRFVAIPIAANRTFNYHYESGPQAMPATPGASFSYTNTLSGVVNKAGTRIIGSARSTFALSNPAGASFTCDTGAVKFVAKN
jgi:hypothetical protein